MPQTSMTSTRIAILGGGLSGLLAARALHRQGIHDFVLLEARSALGGRITSFHSPASSTPATAALHRFDLGPSWYWPDFQPDLHALIEHLGLVTFAQFDEGNMVIEQSAQSAPMRVPGYAQSPASMRLLGGTEALVDALKAEVPPHHIRTGHTVRSLRADGAQVHLTSADALGQDHHWQAEHVLMALPPRLAWRSCIGSRHCLQICTVRGNARPPGWRPTPNTSLCTKRPSGASRACQAKPAAHAALWQKSTTCRSPAVVPRCLVLWVCLPLFEPPYLKMCCASTAGPSWRGCLARQRHTRWPTPSRIGSRTR